jgi:hypothetical protein
VKEFLSTLGVDFEHVNVAAQPSGRERLAGLGVLSVRYVTGAKLQDIADLVGKPYQAQAKLPPEQLVQKLDVVLAAAQRYIRQVPDDRLEMKSPDRDRPLRRLAYHCFNLVEWFIEACNGTPLTYEALNTPPPDTVRSSESIAQYGDTVRQRLRDWWQRDQHRSPDDLLETYYGQQTLHELFERTTWHSAQHARHLIMFLGWIGIEPDQPLTKEDLAGLPLPDAVW